MSKTLTADQRRYERALTEEAERLGLVGVFMPGKRHDKFRVVLPDGSHAFLAVYKTPGVDPGSYAGQLKTRLRAAIARNLERRGIA